MPGQFGGLFQGLANIGEGLASAGKSIGTSMLLRSKMEADRAASAATLKQSAALGIIDRAVTTFIKDAKISDGAKVRVYEDTIRPAAAQLGFFLPPMEVADFRPQYGKYLEQFAAILKSGGSAQEKRAMLDTTMVDITTRDPSVATLFKRFEDQLKDQTEQNIQEMTARYVRVLDKSASDEDRQRLAYEQAVATSPDSPEDLPVVREQKQELALALHESQKRALKEIQARRMTIGEESALLEQTPTGAMREVPVSGVPEVGGGPALPSERLTTQIGGTSSVSTPTGVLEEAAPSVGAQDTGIATLDAEINQLLATRGRARVVGGPTTASINKRIDQLQQERTRLIGERTRTESQLTRQKEREAVERTQQKAREAAQLAPTRTTQEIALTKFGVPFEKLDQTQRHTVRAIGQEEKLAEAKARSAGAEIEKRKTDFAHLARFSTEAVRQIDQVLTAVEAQPEAFGASGAVAASIIGVADQVVNFGRLVGLGFDVDKNVNQLLGVARDFSSGIVSETEFNEQTTQPFAAELRKTGVTKVALRSQMVGLAITLAAQEAIRGNGRLTTDAVKRQLERIGLPTQSPEAFKNAMLNLREEVATRLQVFEQVMLKGEVPVIGPPPVRRGPPLGKQGVVTNEGITILRRRPAR